MAVDTRRYRILWRFTIALSLAGILLGLLLRYYFVQPLHFNFKYLLHAHSHLMLLGWLFPALLLLLYSRLFSAMPGNHFRLFLALQFCVLGMMCTFPFQGYGLYSIVFSTLHIFLSYVLLWKLWRHCRGKALIGNLVQAGIIFHFLSTIGPFALGPIIAIDLRGSDLYHQAIYFYLHFQYNGSFFMFLLALILLQWQKAGGRMRSGLFIGLMAAGVVLTWAHSLDYSYDGWWINALGGAGSVLQIMGGILLFRSLNVKALGKIGLIALTALGLKWVFQLMGSLPVLANEVAQNRFLLIAWLHFIFLGIYTPFIWLRLADKVAGLRLWVKVFWFFFLLTELALVLPFLQLFPQFYRWPQVTFALYVGLVISWFIIAVQWWRSKPIE